MRWATYYDSAGQCVSISHEMPIPLDSWFLKMTIGYQSTVERESGHVRVANALRLMFGVPIARELVLVRHYTTDTQEIAEYSDVGYASFFDGQNLNLFDDPPIEGAKFRPMPLEASTLLDKAFAQRYPTERFILMWLAFEAVIHTHSGGGQNGDKRRRYFAEVLGSQEASDEVKRLRDIRHDAFKEGKVSGIDFERACWSLYHAFQLAVLEDCPQRTAYLAGYLAYIDTLARR